MHKSPVTHLPNLEQEQRVRLEHSSEYDCRLGEQTPGTTFQSQSVASLTTGTNVQDFDTAND